MKLERLTLPCPTCRNRGFVEQQFKPATTDACPQCASVAEDEWQAWLRRPTWLRLQSGRDERMMGA